MVPGVDECLRLMQAQDMLANIRAHSLMVAAVAEGLRSLLAESGLELPADLVRAGALLHDIAKTACLDGSCEHASAGAELCRELGWPAVAEIVESHVFLPVIPDEPDPVTLVFYADKRVNHNRVVSIEEREEYIIAAYGRGDAARISAIRANVENNWRRVEKIIFSRITIGPDAVDQDFAARHALAAAAAEAG